MYTPLRQLTYLGTRGHHGLRTTEHLSKQPDERPLRSLFFPFVRSSFPFALPSDYQARRALEPTPIPSLTPRFRPFNVD